MRRYVPAVFIALSALIGFFGYRYGTRPAVREIGGAAITQAPQSGASQEPQLAVAAPQIPDTLPTFVLADRAGVKHKLADWDGHPRIINFWATWCEPCRREIPLLKSLRESRQADQLEVIGVAVDNRPDVIAYAEKAGIQYPILIGEQDGFEGALAFGVNGVLPFSVFADSKGRIAALKVGELKAEQTEFILDTIREVDQGRIDLPAAKARIAERMRNAAPERSPT